jgi:hypothetical protein
MKIFQDEELRKKLQKIEKEIPKKYSHKMNGIKEYCTQNYGKCHCCSLSSYGRDCKNNKIPTKVVTVRKH